MPCGVELRGVGLRLPLSPGPYGHPAGHPADVLLQEPLERQRVPAATQVAGLGLVSWWVGGSAGLWATGGGTRCHSRQVAHAWSAPVAVTAPGGLFQISSAACGYGFTLLSSKTKDVTKVWGMGLNKDSQLGFQRSRKDKGERPGVALTSETAPARGAAGPAATPQRECPPHSICTLRRRDGPRLCP